MNYISVYDHMTGKRLAFLQNAYAISYTEELNQLWTASFSLPMSDGKNAFCKPFNYIEVFDAQKYVGLFRIMPSRSTKNAGTKEIRYKCEHVLATLIDDVLVGWHEIGNAGVSTSEVIRYVLDRQETHRWEMLSCDFAHEYLYGWEDENLLAALFSIPKSFEEAYRWEFDTSSTPWLISLKAEDPVAKGDVRYRKNMIGIVKDTDPTSIVTRLYPYGYGEGVNTLNIKSVNNGTAYLDSDTQDKYGIKVKIWKDPQYQTPEALMQAARAMLDAGKEPYVSYSIDTAHIGNLKMLHAGDVVRVVDDEDETDFYSRILAIDKPDVTGAPDQATITIANRSKDLATTLADIADRQRISSAYSQGAVTLFFQNYADNCSADKPAEFRIYIPANVVHINEINLDCNARPFRGYTKGTKNSQQVLTTTQGGGGYSSSSEKTSSAGGGETVSSNPDAWRTMQSSTYNVQGDTMTTGSHGHSASGTGSAIGSSHVLTGKTAGHQHYYYRPEYHTHGAPSIYSNGNHSHHFNVVISHYHQMDHTHTISLSSHRHTVTVDVNIPAHSHEVTIPAHAHPIEYGIYTGTTASTLTVIVDGTTAGIFGRSINELNLLNYLGKDNNGKVTRGRHTIRIVPDVDTRVEADIVYQLFANSRGGVQN